MSKVRRRAKLQLRSQTQAGNRAVFKEQMIKDVHNKARQEGRGKHPLRLLA
jgi:hypothetical protein